jgi:glycosyltransferase involved in cell wall biosynthesis
MRRTARPTGRACPSRRLVITLLCATVTLARWRVTSSRRARTIDGDPAVAIVLEHHPAVRRCLRLAVVTETWPPEVNGVALTASRFVAGLTERNHDVQLVRPRQAHEGGIAPGDRREQERSEVLFAGLPIPRYPGLRMGLPAKRALVRMWTLRRPDLVHVVTEGPLGWSALQAARSLRLPVCSDFRTNFHAYSGHYGIGWLKKPIASYLRKFHNHCDLTLVPTEATRQDLAMAGFRNLAVVARGVDTRLFAPERRSDALRAAWGAGPGDPVALYVGRIAPEKNLDALAASFVAVRAAAPGARLLVVGDGPARAALQTRFPDAVFAGTRTGIALAEHYASSDLFLFPSLTETFGNVTLEAMASGLAVIAFDRAAAGVLIADGHSGCLVPGEAVADFAQRARATAAALPAARALGRAARESVLAMDWERVVVGLESLYFRVLADRDPVGRGAVLDALRADVASL